MPAHRLFSKGLFNKDPTSKDPTSKDPTSKDPTSKDPASSDLRSRTLPALPAARPRGCHVLHCLRRAAAQQGGAPPPHPGPAGGPSKERSRGSAPRALVRDSRYYPGSRKAPGTAGGHRIDGHRASGHLAYGYRAGQDRRFHKGGGRSRGRNGNGSEPSACSGCGRQAAWRCRH
ncbi:hypothetical protein StoSoilB19_13140 [Arthrobacter sp. StoSoilB19]|nr:hypothetical protein StoSoilB19_13140 [Arthrobacter sp. StoSoilB19]